MNREITLDMLKNAGACTSGLDFFEHMYGKSVILTTYVLAQALACHKTRGNIWWIQENFKIDLSLADTSQCLDFRETTFNSIDLSRATLSGSRLEHCIFHKCTGIGTNFHNVDMHRATIHSSNFSSANFSDTDLCQTHFNTVMLGSADMSGIIASFSTFKDCSMYKANLTSAAMVEASFSKCCLDGADANFANLRFAKFLECSLRKADFSGADLRYADFSGSDLTGARFNVANTVGVIWPEGYWENYDYSSSL